MIQPNFIEVLELLERDKKVCEILKSCPYHVLKSMYVKRYYSEEIIIEQGKCYDKMIFIVDGEADIYVESTQGKKYNMATYQKYSFIGELELFNQKPYTSDAL